MKPRGFLFVSAVMALSMILAACSGSAGSPTAAAPGVTQPTTAAAVPTTAVAQPTSSAQQPTAAATAPSASTAEATSGVPTPTTAPTAVPTVSVGTAEPGQVTGACPLQVEDGAKISFSGWGDTTEQKIYRDSISRFLTLCKGVSVDYIPIPTNFQDKMKAQMAGGTAPDVFYVDDQLMTAFADSGQLLALDDYMKEANVTANDFVPSLMSEFTQGGKTYALPKDWGTLGLIYLPEAFKAAGIPEPTDNWTWDDMRNAAKTIATKTSNKYAGFCMAADWARFAPFVMSNGGDLATLDGKTALLDQQPVIQAATFVDDMFKEKSLVRPSDLGASWCGEAIGKQLVAMTTEGGWMVNFMTQTYPNVQWKAVQIPQGSKTRADIIFTNGIGVNAATKYPKAAAALAIFITGKTNQAEIVKTGFAYSTHPDQANLIQNPNDKAIAAGGLLKDSHPAYWGPYTGKLEDIVSKALERVFLGSQSVQDSFNQAQQEATAALAGQ